MHSFQSTVILYLTRGTPDDIITTQRLNIFLIGAVISEIIQKPKKKKFCLFIILIGDLKRRKLYDRRVSFFWEVIQKHKNE